MEQSHASHVAFCEESQVKFEQRVKAAEEKEREARDKHADLEIAEKKAQAEIDNLTGAKEAMENQITSLTNQNE